jgi:hypothetical protein
MPRKKKAKFELDPNRKVFERQPGELDKPWRAFVIYRDMGFQRTLIKASDVYKKATGAKGKVESVHQTLQKWSAEYSWVMRSAEWDNELDKIRRRKKIFEIEEMKERHLKLATSLQGLGAIELKKWLNKVQTSKENEKVELSTTDVRALIELGIRIERLNRDEPESVTKVEKEVSVEDKRESLKNLLINPDIGEEVRKLAKKLDVN